MKMFGIALVALLALAFAGLGGNFARNVKTDSDVPRPYDSLSDANLVAMATELQREIDQLAGKYESAKRNAIRARDKGLFTDQLEEFRRVQDRAHSTRSLGAALSEKELMLRKIQAEQTYRRANATKTQTFLRRLMSFSR